MENVIGCDVSRHWIDVQTAERAFRIDNNLKAAAQLARELPAMSLIGMEATGELHVVLADALVKYGHTVFVINPRWVHNYGKSLGLRGKTDRTDAALIARFVAAEGHGLHPYVSATAQNRQLRKLLLQRRKLVQLKVATRQSLGKAGAAIVKEFEKSIARAERAIELLVRHSPRWKTIYDRLLGQPGVGPVLGAHLLDVLTRIPFKNQDAFIAHTGLDPRACDSGQKRGRRYLTGHGDAVLRATLYIAAMSACRRGPWRPFYQAQLQKGLAPTAAIVVLARKLARVAFSLFKSEREFDPTFVSAPKIAGQRP
ncbi:MAG TPA: IS110 family transposase [Usitatibacter sp.]|nr:IS110 family transposase [Usitatibacter sp.]